MVRRGRGYAWEQFTEGNTAAEKHRAWSSDVPAEAAEIVADLVGPAVYEEHPALSLRAAELWVRIRRAETWLAEHGDLTPKGEVRPVLAALNAWDATLMKLSDRLGLSPLSAARLDVLTGDVRPGRPAIAEDPEEQKQRVLALVEELKERRDKKAAAEQFERSRPRPLGSPPRLALPAGPSVVARSVLVDDERDAQRRKVEELLDVLAERAREKREREERGDE